MVFRIVNGQRMGAVFDVRRIRTGSAPDPQIIDGAVVDNVPISRAVAASTARPMIYTPVEIKGRHPVDGGLRSTTNMDIAVEAGASVLEGQALPGDRETKNLYERAGITARLITVSRRLA